MKYSKPVVKAMLSPFVNEENTGIRIGGTQSEIARDIIVDDPKQFYELLKFLDGTHDLHEVSKNFNLELADVEIILKQLKDSGVIYEDDSSEFNKEEIEYYNRSINFYKWIDTDGIYYNYWDVQKRIKNSKILLLGCGGTGSIAGVNLARIGFGEITIVDFDTVEISNLNRQMFRYRDVGREKCAVLKEELEEINPYIKVNAINKNITRAEDILSLGDNYDVVVCCIDKPSNIVDIVQKYTDITGIPWILGGYASTIVNQGIFTSEGKTFSDMLEDNKQDSYASRKVNTNVYWKWDTAVVAPIANISGSFSALYALYYVTGLRKLKNSLIQHIDLYNVQNLDSFSYTIGGHEEDD